MLAGLVFKRKQLVSRANYLIGPDSLLAQELCKIDFTMAANWIALRKSFFFVVVK